MSANLVLRVVSGPHKGRAYYFPTRARCTIGRASDCFVQLNGDERDGVISRHHCTLDIDLPDVKLRDLNSLNGTRVNGESVDSLPGIANIHDFGFLPGKEVQLWDQDEIEVGGTVLRVEVLLEGPDAMMMCEEISDPCSVCLAN